MRRRRASQPRNRAAAAAAASAGHNPKAAKQERLGKDQAQDAGGGRAERHAKPDLSPTPHDGVRHQSIQTNTGQRQRQPAEQTRQPGEEKRLCIQAIDLFVLRPHVENRESRSDIPDGLTDRVDDRRLTVGWVRWIGYRHSHGKTGVAIHPLECGKIDGGGRRAAKVRVLGVPSDPDDFNLLAWRRSKTDGLSDRIPAIEVGADERLVYHSHQRSLYSGRAH